MDWGKLTKHHLDMKWTTAYLHQPQYIPKYRKPAGPSFYPGVINLRHAGPVQNQALPKICKINTF